MLGILWDLVNNPSGVVSNIGLFIVEADTGRLGKSGRLQLKVSVAVVVVEELVISDEEYVLFRC
jgi:hypothetical protein